MQPSDRHGLQDRSSAVSCLAWVSADVSPAVRPEHVTLSERSWCRGMRASSLPRASDLLQRPMLKLQKNAFLLYDSKDATCPERLITCTGESPAS